MRDRPHEVEATTLIPDLIDRIALQTNEERSALMIDLHGDLAGILSIANGRTPQAGAKGGKSRQTMEDSDLSAVTEWAKMKLVAGAHNALAPLFVRYDVKTTAYPEPRP